jgi:hypothetical protein
VASSGVVGQPGRVVEHRGVSYVVWIVHPRPTSGVLEVHTGHCIGLRNAGHQAPLIESDTGDNHGPDLTTLGFAGLGDLGDGT